MLPYNIELAQRELAQEIQRETRLAGELTESQCAAIFAKILVKQTNPRIIAFCDEGDMYISKTPVGYDVVGFYINSFQQKTPFSVSVTQQNGAWFPAQKYVASDTKSCSSYIWLWVLLCVGCALMGMLMSFLISAAIGI